MTFLKYGKYLEAIRFKDIKHKHCDGKENIRGLFDDFSVCGAAAYSGDLYFHVFSRLCVGNEYYETLDSGYAFSLAARFRYVRFVFLSHLNWARLKAPTITASSFITHSYLLLSPLSDYAIFSLAA